MRRILLLLLALLLLCGTTSGMSFDSENYTMTHIDTLPLEGWIGYVGNIEVGDVDNDGADEIIVVGNIAGNSVENRDVLFYDLDGTKTRYADVTSSNYILAEASVHDVTEDGINELLCIYSKDTSPPDGISDLYRFNTGGLVDSNLNNDIMTSGSNNPKAISWIDINNDEHYYSCGCGSGETVNCYTTFSSHSTTEIDDFSISAEDTIAWDIDGDGEMELLVVEGWASNAATIWMYEIDPTTGLDTSKTKLFNNDSIGGTHFTAVIYTGDIDNDGIDNLIIHWSPSGGVYNGPYRIEAYEFDGITHFGEGNFSESIVIDASSKLCPRGHGKMFVSDVDNDGLNELVTGAHIALSVSQYPLIVNSYDISSGGASITKNELVNCSVAYMGGTTYNYPVVTPAFISQGKFVVAVQKERSNAVSLETEIYILESKNGASADTLTVCASGCDFPMIQDAVTAASAYDTIYVYNGTYTENIDIATAHLTLKGEGMDVVTVRAADAEDHVFEVTADWANISGFAVAGATDGCHYSAGISLCNANYCNISSNNASNNLFGFSLNQSSNNNMANNMATLNDQGGIVFLDSSNNTMVRNRFVNNSGGGITLYNSSNNKITHSTIDSNGGCGIWLSYYSSDNLIYANSFHDHWKNIGLYSAGPNIWNSTSPITYLHNANTYTNYLGNYWDNYTDIDADNDGVWDNPYPIDSDNDYHPLVEPFENYAAPPPGKIAFASSCNGNQEIYVINSDGTGDPINLTNRPDADDGDPTWSSDGKRIAFSSNRSGNWTTYAMNADGSDQVCLLEGVANAGGPAWSPDGTKIAVAVKINPSDDFEIYTVDIQSRALTQVTDNISTDSHPAWSPDSHKIVFTSDRDGNQELYVADLLADTQTRLTDEPSNDDYPEWSPDGCMIAFVSERDGNPEIYSMDIASKAITRLTYNDSIDKHAQWSPDSQKIVFISDRDGGGDLDVYVMKADGTGVTCMVDWDGEETHPTWSSGSAPDQIVRGDLNHDDRITPADAAIALRLAATGAHNSAADVSGDNRITSLDALMILQAAAGRIEL